MRGSLQVLRERPQRQDQHDALPRRLPDGRSSPRRLAQRHPSRQHDHRQPDPPRLRPPAPARQTTPGLLRLPHLTQPRRVRTRLQRPRRKRTDTNAPPENLLVRQLRHARRPVRHPLDDQLRTSRLIHPTPHPNPTHKEISMRFMMLMIPGGYENAKPGTMPDPKAVAAMMKFNQSLQ